MLKGKDFMSRIQKIIGVFIFSCFTSFFIAGQISNAPKTGSPELEKIKQLAGTWEGSHAMGDKIEKMTVEYEVTGGGSAVVEKLSPGTPHEMVSVYYDKNKKLTMTHYCMLGNRPEMTLKSASENEFDLSLARGNSVNIKEPHMHALKLTFSDSNHLTQSWSMYEKGKEKQVTTIELTRKQ